MSNPTPSAAPAQPELVEQPPADQFVPSVVEYAAVMAAAPASAPPPTATVLGTPAPVQQQASGGSGGGPAPGPNALYAVGSRLREYAGSTSQQVRQPPVRLWCWQRCAAPCCSGKHAPAACSQGPDPCAVAPCSASHGQSWQTVHPSPSHPTCRRCALHAATAAGPLQQTRQPAQRLLRGYGALVAMWAAPAVGQYGCEP